VTKYVNELYAGVFQRSYGLETIGLRYFNVFGRRQDPDGAYAAVIPRWVASLLAAAPARSTATARAAATSATSTTCSRPTSWPPTAPAEATDDVYNVAVGEHTTLNQLFRAIRDGLAEHRPEVARAEPSTAPSAPATSATRWPTSPRFARGSVRARRFRRRGDPVRPRVVRGQRPVFLRNYTLSARMAENAPPIVGRRIRFAVVGCGRISGRHLEALKTHAENAEIVAVCDPDPAALRAAEQETGARGFSSLDRLLAESDAEVVVLATPSGMHADQGVQIAGAGRHVVTEKPMATRWEDGKRLVHACDMAGVKLFVVKQNRRNATLQLLKRAMDAGRFGRIYMVTSTCSGTARRTTTTAPAGAGRGSLTAAR
jgi:hypothetical protein